MSPSQLIPALVQLVEVGHVGVFLLVKVTVLFQPVLGEAVHAVLHRAVHIVAVVGPGQDFCRMGMEKYTMNVSHGL